MNTQNTNPCASSGDDASINNNAVSSAKAEEVDYGSLTQNEVQTVVANKELIDDMARHLFFEFKLNDFGHRVYKDYMWERIQRLADSRLIQYTQEWIEILPANPQFNEFSEANELLEERKDTAA